jgi:hypothetical protein
MGAERAGSILGSTSRTMAYGGTLPGNKKRIAHLQ